MEIAVRRLPSIKVSCYCYFVLGITFFSEPELHRTSHAASLLGPDCPGNGRVFGVGLSSLWVSSPCLLPILNRGPQTLSLK